MKTVQEDLWSYKLTMTEAAVNMSLFRLLVMCSGTHYSGADQNDDDDDRDRSRLIINKNSSPVRLCCELCVKW